MGGNVAFLEFCVSLGLDVFKLDGFVSFFFLFSLSMPFSHYFSYFLIGSECSSSRKFEGALKCFSFSLFFFFLFLFFFTFLSFLSFLSSFNFFL